MTGERADRIRARIVERFAPERLDVVDDSDKHAGHAGSHGRGESHFTVRITAEGFRGLGRLQRQSQVYAALKDELAGPVHALSVQASAPGE